jgi:hypothetical protein
MHRFKRVIIFILSLSLQSQCCFAHPWDDFVQTARTSIQSYSRVAAAWYTANPFDGHKTSAAIGTAIGIGIISSLRSRNLDDANVLPNLPTPPSYPEAHQSSPPNRGVYAAFPRFMEEVGIAEKLDWGEWISSHPWYNTIKAGTTSIIGGIAVGAAVYGGFSHFGVQSDRKIVTLGCGASSLIGSSLCYWGVSSGGRVSTLHRKAYNSLTTLEKSYLLASYHEWVASTQQQSSELQLDDHDGKDAKTSTTSVPTTIGGRTGSVSTPLSAEIPAIPSASTMAFGGAAAIPIEPPAKMQPPFRSPDPRRFMTAVELYNDNRASVAGMDEFYYIRQSIINAVRVGSEYDEKRWGNKLPTDRERVTNDLLAGLNRGMEGMREGGNPVVDTRSHYWREVVLPLVVANTGVAAATRFQKALSVIIATNALDKILIAFRGTQGFLGLDGLTDIKIWPKSVKQEKDDRLKMFGNLIGHMGFIDTAYSCWEDSPVNLPGAIKGLIGDKSLDDFQIIVTGHSLGGAVADVTALRLLHWIAQETSKPLEHINRQNKVVLLTMGQPAVWDCTNSSHRIPDYFMQPENRLRLVCLGYRGVLQDIVPVLSGTGAGVLQTLAHLTLRRFGYKWPFAPWLFSHAGSGTEKKVRLPTKKWRGPFLHDMAHYEEAMMADGKI